MVDAALGITQLHLTLADANDLDAIPIDFDLCALVDRQSLPLATSTRTTATVATLLDFVLHSGLIIRIFATVFVG